MAGFGWWLQDQTGHRKAIAMEKRANGKVEEEICDEIVNNSMVDVNKSPEKIHSNAIARVSKNEKSITKKQLSLQINQQVKNNNVVNTIFTLQNNVTNDSKTVTPITKEFVERPAETFTFISNTALSAVKYEKTTFDSIEIAQQESAIQKKSKWKMGIELAASTSTSTILDGYAAGVVTDLPFKNKKFSLLIGLNVNVQQRYFQFNALNTQEATMDKGISKAADHTAKARLHFTTHSIGLPILLQYKFQPKWSVTGGAQVMYLLNAKNLRNTDALQPDGLTPQFSNAANYYALDNLKSVDFDSKLSLDQLRRFDVALAAGIGYHPSAKLGIRLQYQYGVMDLLKAAELKSYNPALRLSAMYFLSDGTLIFKIVMMLSRL